MDDGDLTAVAEAQVVLEAMASAMQTHDSEHSAHTELAECLVTEGANELAMSAATSSLQGCHQTWWDSIECAMLDMH